MKPLKPGVRSTLWRALRDWWDEWPRWAVLSIVWVVCWMTVVLGPPATFALAYAAYGSVREGQAYTLNELAGEARQRLGLSWLWGLMNLVIIALSFVSLVFYNSLSGSIGSILSGFNYLVIFLIWAAQFYAVAYLYQMEPLHLGRALRNGLYIALAAPLYTLAVAGVALVAGALSLFLVAPLLLGVPGLIALLGARAVDDRLSAFGIRKEEPSPLEEP